MLFTIFKIFIKILGGGGIVYMDLKKLVIETNPCGGRYNLKKLARQDNAEKFEHLVIFIDKS